MTDARYLLKRDTSTADHLARTVNQDTTIHNMMAHGKEDNHRGGFVERDEKGNATEETPEEYRQRVLIDEPDFLAKVYANAPNQNFFLLQEAPQVSQGNELKDGTKVGEKFTQAVRNKLNGGTPGTRQWDHIIQHGVTLPKCIFYNTHEYIVDEKATALLQEEILKEYRSQGLTDDVAKKEVLPVVFQSMKNPAEKRVKFNVQLEPCDPTLKNKKAREELVKKFIAAGENVAGCVQVDVEGDFNFTMGLSNEKNHLVSNVSNVHTYDEHKDIIGQKKHGSVDGGVTKLRDQPLKRATEKLIDPRTGHVLETDAKNQPQPTPEELTKRVEDSSYVMQVFGDNPFDLDLTNLASDLVQLPPFVQGNSPTIEAWVEVNNNNAHRVAIQSSTPIEAYEYLFKQNTPGVSRGYFQDNFCYYLDLEGPNPAPESAYRCPGVIYYDQQASQFAQEDPSIDDEKLRLEQAASSSFIVTKARLLTSEEKQAILQEHQKNQDDLLQSLPESEQKVQSEVVDLRTKQNSLVLEAQRAAIQEEYGQRPPEEKEMSIDDYIGSIPSKLSKRERAVGAEVIKTLSTTNDEYKALEGKEEKLNADYKTADKEGKAALSEQIDRVVGEKEAMQKKAIAEKQDPASEKLRAQKEKTDRAKQNVESSTEYKEIGINIFIKNKRELQEIRDQISDAEKINGAISNLTQMSTTEEQQATQTIGKIRSECTEYTAHLDEYISSTNQTLLTDKKDIMAAVNAILEDRNRSDTDKLLDLSQYLRSPHKKGSHINPLQIIASSRDREQKGALLGKYLMSVVPAVAACTVILAPLAYLVLKAIWTPHGKDTANKIEEHLPEPRKLAP